MASSETILTPKLRLLPLSEKHLTERYVSWLNDPDCTRYSQQRNRVHTLETCRDYMQSFTSGPHFLWAIETLSENPGHIGNINAYVDPSHSVADVGILIGEKNVAGQGLATEAWLGVCDFLLRNANIRKVTAGTLGNNEPMLRLMRRAGMENDGCRISQVLWNEQPVDIVHAALFRESWLLRHPNGPFANPTLPNT
jgi:[ribosomal protein S5]-alanine N-acetyltransferase